MLKLLSLLVLGSHSIYAIPISFNCQSNPIVIPNGTGTTQIFCPGADPGAGNAINSVTVALVGDYTGGAPAGTNIVMFTGVSSTFTGSNVAIGGPSPTSVANMFFTFGLSGPVSGINPLHFPVSASVLQGSVGLSSVALSVTYDYTPFTSSQSNPLLPSFGGGSGFFTFTNVNSGCWCDPPFTNGYDYAGTGGTLFSSLNLPTGFGSFNIYVGNGFGTLVGSFLSGANVDFVSLLGSAQSSFRIAGITPQVDSADPLAFPLQVFFSTPTGSFTQTPLADIPEPTTWMGMAAGLGVLWIKRKRAS